MTQSDPTRRLNNFLAALPASPERTQALVDLNVILTNANDNLHSLGALERERTPLAALPTTPAPTCHPSGEPCDLCAIPVALWSE